jgi:hypothetical protein
VIGSTIAHYRVTAKLGDGRWLAYTSDESGQTEVYVQAFPGPGGKWQVSTGGGHSPVWARNGKELFFRSGAKTMAVPVATEPMFSPGATRQLFEANYYEMPRREANYDVSPDGQHFLVVKGSSGGTAPPATSWCSTGRRN